MLCTSDKMKTVTEICIRSSVFKQFIHLTDPIFQLCLVAKLTSVCRVLPDSPNLFPELRGIAPCFAGHLWISWLQVFPASGRSGHKYWFTSYGFNFLIIEIPFFIVLNGPVLGAKLLIQLFSYLILCSYICSVLVFVIDLFFITI